jgi:hypothetical protein
MQWEKDWIKYPVIRFDMSIAGNTAEEMDAAERNLAKVLTEINRAQSSHDIVSVKNLQMTEFAKKSLARLWAVTPFYVEVWAYYGDEGFAMRNLTRDGDLAHKIRKSEDFSQVGTSGPDGVVDLHLKRSDLPTGFFFRPVGYKKKAHKSSVHPKR